MITHIRGRLVEKNPTSVIIDCSGVGYELHISLNTYSLIGSEETIELYTHLQVKEDSHTLYGFVQKIEREVFRLLITVSGIGANTARTILSSLTSEELRGAIAAENVSKIQSVKGIGAKTAQRLIIELKDKILKIYEFDEVFPQQDNTVKEEALSALEVLGFSRKQAEKVVDAILSEERELGVESVIKIALKKL
ncbi:MAG: Holliday junction branch migration protein RuvA [Flavobacteriaceae bacterium]|jgi:Holliday junction DNA helicase RuvA|nr:Holliday junction branch migration protein RuvA [Flavobacteriaceae bacterium]NVJ73019.1 Holliday junction branch migration protein RuvA [Flavobacteriaceae bacterium]